MTLHALRQRVGDDVFFALAAHVGPGAGRRRVTTEEFIATAERVSGQQLDDFFETWLFTPEKPAGIESPLAARTANAFAAPATGSLERLLKR